MAPHIIPPVSPTRKSLLEALALVSLFAYTVWFRVHGVDEGFVLMGDQIRDWDVARRRLVDLPLGGVPSSAGGATVGPAYYWVLWTIASVVGPTFDNLPHAGGIGISLLQALADIVLVWALARRTGSLAVALAIGLAAATSVTDAVVSSTIWNPPVAVAFIKVSLACVLIDGGRSFWTAMLATLTAWGAVQAHTASVLVAGPVLAWTACRPLLEQRHRDAVARVAGIVALIALLQVPWLLNAASVGVQGQSQIGDSLTAVLGSPLGSLRLAASAVAMTENLDTILAVPYHVPWLGGLFVLGGLALLLLSRDPRLVVCGPVPLVVAALAFSLWQGPTFERYWYLVCAPSAAITLLAWPAWLPIRWRTGVGLAMLGIVLAAQPARFALVRATAVYPGYGSMVRGCRQIVGDDRPLKAIEVSGTLMAAVDPLWLCSILGARLTADAVEVAVIDVPGAGAVHYRAQP